MREWVKIIIGSCGGTDDAAHDASNLGSQIKALTVGLIDFWIVPQDSRAAWMRAVARAGASGTEVRDAARAAAAAEVVVMNGSLG